MADLLAKFATLPAYGIAALIALLLYAVQSEIRFGKRARRSRAGAADPGRTPAPSRPAGGRRDRRGVRRLRARTKTMGGPDSPRAILENPPDSGGTSC